MKNKDNEFCVQSIVACWLPLTQILLARSPGPVVGLQLHCDPKAPWAADTPPPGYCLTAEPLVSQLKRKEAQQAWLQPSQHPPQPSCAPRPDSPSESQPDLLEADSGVFHSLCQQFVKKMRHVSSKCTTRDRSSVSCQNTFHMKHEKSREPRDEGPNHRPTQAAKHP